MNPAVMNKFYVLLTVHLDIIQWRKTNSMYNLFLVYFVNLYMFRVYSCFRFFNPLI